MTTNHRPKSVYGTELALASGHHLATMTAQSVLEQGGSLIDAMIASSAVLTVALPHTSSLGGCAMMVYFDAASQKTYALNGSGHIPGAAVVAEFPDGVEQRGPRCSVTPTLVRFWAQAHRRFGVLPWAVLLQPAIRYAEQGVACAEELARNLSRTQDALRDLPGFSQTFARDGQFLQRGQLIQQPALANVLRTVAEQGETGFYQGWVADSLVSFFQQHGGLITQEDLDDASATWVIPESADYREHCVHVMPPNSVGRLMLEQLKLSAADRRKNTGALQQAADIEVAVRALQDAHIPAVDPAKDKGDTTGFVAVDQHGNAISMLQSIFQPMGSGCVDTDTGILMNNRMFDCSIEPDDANFVVPGRRPRHTLNPYLLTRDGRAAVAGNSPGGISQTITGFQVIRAMLDGDLSLGQLVDQPRWSLTRDFQVLLETGISTDVAVRLREQGFDVVENSQHAFYFGSVKIARRLSTGAFEAAADIRRQACAMAW